MHCIKCNCKIPKGRLRILPNAKECVKCSSEDLNMVRSVITGKTTYSEWEVIKNKETKFIDSSNWFQLTPWFIP